MFQRLLPLLVLFYCHLAFADQLIIEPDMGRTPVLNAIHEAKKSIELVMYGFTDDELLSAITQARAADKDVKIILEQSPYKAQDENTRAITLFQHDKTPWHGSIAPYRLIHQKTLIIDHHEALVMTFNFTRSSFKNERNFGLIIDNPAQVTVIDDLFHADWQATNRATLSPITNRANQQGVVISPETSRMHLTTLISNAHHSIDIYAQTVNDYKTVGLIAKAARNNIAIRILTTDTMREKQAAYLAKANVDVRYSKNLRIHAKALVIDNDTVVLGSINFTRASIEDNRELAVVTHDKNVVRQLSGTFNHDWEAAQSNQSAKNTRKLSTHHLTKSDKETLRMIQHYLTKTAKHLNKYL